MAKKLFHPHLQNASNDMARISAVPLWEIYHQLMADEPTPAGQAYRWRYHDLRPLLIDAGAQISTAEAERRVLVLKNPGIDHPGIARTLTAGVQLVLPGEIAPAHRHTQSAIRFVLESSGGYTAVEGERCLMRRGDFIITPAWCWHDHCNTGNSPLIWVDGLDVPMVNLFGAGFAENHRDEQQPIYRGDNDSVLRWGSGLRPYIDTTFKPYSRVFNYSYERSRASLMQLAGTDEPHPQHGYKLIYANPRTGGHVLPTLSAFLQCLPAGFTTASRQSTESTVYIVVEGVGIATIGDRALDFTVNDIFVVPNWMPIRLSAQGETILFSFSDRAAQENLGIWREDSIRPAQPQQ